MGCTYKISARRKFEEGEKRMGGKTGWVDFKKCDKLPNCPAHCLACQTGKIGTAGHKCREMAV